jgi:hypothetical protein
MRTLRAPRSETAVVGLEPARSTNQRRDLLASRGSVLPLEGFVP